MAGSDDWNSWIDDAFESYFCLFLRANLRWYEGFFRSLSLALVVVESDVGPIKYIFSGNRRYKAAYIGMGRWQRMDGRATGLLFIAYGMSNVLCIEGQRVSKNTEMALNLSLMATAPNQIINILDEILFLRMTNFFIIGTDDPKPKYL